MSAWTSDELQRIGSAEELQIAALRQDDTLRKPVIIWVVRLDDNLYVRSVKGLNGAWYRGVQLRHEGRIWAGGVEKDVTFVEAGSPELNARIDAAYAAKYRRYPSSVSAINSPEAKGTTIRLEPREVSE